MKMISAKGSTRLIAGAVLAAGLAAGWIGLQRRQTIVPQTFAAGTGRIEATQHDVSAKRAGRLEAIVVAEGSPVSAGQVLARMDVDDLQAELRQAEAELKQARQEKRQAFASMEQQQASIAQNPDAIAKQESALAVAQKDSARLDALVRQELVERRLSEEAQARLRAIEAALAQELTKKQLAEALLKQAAAQIDQRNSAIEAGDAKIRRIESHIRDSALHSPIDGRVFAQVAKSGDMLAAGGKILTVQDPTDVYMIVSLSATLAGRFDVGAEARIILDAAPEQAIPASVSFVGPREQFNAEGVGNNNRGQDPMLRIQVKVDSDWLKKHIEKLAIGSPGKAYIRISDAVPWPANLQVKLP